MKCSWRQTFRRLAAGCIISGSMAWSSAMCYAVTLASDSASDPVYANGWAAGQNGGSGFTPWNFESGYFDPFDLIFYPYSQPHSHVIDDGLQSGAPSFTGPFSSSPYNSVGTPAINGNKRAWTIINDPNVWDNGPDSTSPPPANWPGGHSEGVPRAGRGFPALQPGQTLSVVVDNPNHRPPFNGGFFINLNSNTNGVHGNICFADRACHYVPNPNLPGTWMKAADPKNALSIMNWEYNGGFGFGYGQLHAGGATGTGGFTSLFSYAGPDPQNPAHPENTSNGWRFEITMVTPTTFNLNIFLLGDSDPNVADYTITNGTFDNALNQQGNPRPIDWIQFSHVSLPSDIGTPGPGDFDMDGKVDAGDYVLWRKKNGTNTYLHNDNGLGSPIGPAHYALWRANFGKVSGPPTVGTDFYIRSMTITNTAGSGVGGGAVPEPGTFVYIVAAAAGGFGLVRRRRS